MFVFESMEAEWKGNDLGEYNQVTGFTNNSETANHKTRQTSYRPVGYARKKSVDPKHNFGKKNCDSLSSNARGGVSPHL